MKDEEYKKLLENVEDVPVSNRFLAEVNERIEADSFFKRAFDPVGMGSRRI